MWPRRVLLGRDAIRVSRNQAALRPRDGNQSDCEVFILAAKYRVNGTSKIKSKVGCASS